MQNRLLRVSFLFCFLVGCGNLRSEKLGGKDAASDGRNDASAGGQAGSSASGGSAGALGSGGVLGSGGAAGRFGAAGNGGLGGGGAAGQASSGGSLGSGGGAGTMNGGQAGTVPGAGGRGGRGATGTGGAATGGAGSGGKGSGGAPADGGTDAPDAFCNPGPVELCFNGLDDDCDGLTDCADPDCNSVAVCVPANQSFSLGVTIDAASSCPVGFQAGPSTLIHQGVTGGSGCNGCTCTVASHCSTVLRAYPSTTDCTGVPVALASLDETSKCVSLPPGHSGLPHVDNFTYSGTCSGSGTATPSTWSWSMTMKFCPADPPGQGCNQGYACVHKNPAAYCALGSSSCTPGFTALAGGTWYTSATDGRTCGNCGCQMTGSGDCSNSRVLEHPANECAVANPSSFVLLAGDRCDGFDATSGFDTADLNVAVTGGSCSGKSTMSGAVTPTGAKTVCCQ